KAAAKPKAAAAPKAAAKTEAAAKPKTKAKPKAAATAAAEAPAAAATAGAGTKPAALAAARDGGPDDLKQIKGVGPKMETLLHSMGFFHFDQVASWGADEVSWVDQNLKGFKGRATRDEWVAQAKILAAGGTTEFSAKVDKGGVY
ncbi:helix-hairpin-helix domain-containing protein, partial [Tateyamaria sp.]|uniref:helix-hairpin-helix domain-containing protein n=2 Tax=Tateyamaria sp. TaxID=1929288 RepID=UPI0032929B66